GDGAGERLALEFGRQGFEEVGVEVEGGDLGPLGGQRAGELPADAAGSAGDEDDAVGERGHGASGGSGSAVLRAGWGGECKRGANRRRVASRTGAAGSPCAICFPVSKMGPVVVIR